jgi:hypothetical protein
LERAAEADACSCTSGLSVCCCTEDEFVFFMSGEAARPELFHASPTSSHKLVVDEAQNRDDSVLEAIRLLSNLETFETKLLHIVLPGQPSTV